MSILPQVQKASGERQPFSPDKLRQSLARAGAQEDTIRSIISAIEPMLFEGIRTQAIYQKAFALLRAHRRSLAARYGLKQAIMALGPSGYPFEEFVGHIFRALGFQALVGQTLHGRCITHEVDVVATNDTTCHLVECKFANSPGKFNNVRVPLYIRSRMDDIMANPAVRERFSGLRFESWVVTNTRFTSDALEYGLCSGLNMLSWDLPQERSLKGLIEELGLFPITTLTGLQRAEKHRLLEDGVVLCRQLHSQPQRLEELGITGRRLEALRLEAEELCG